MRMDEDASVVVYLMTGFLESGKTSFLKQTIGKQYFHIDGETLLILCEEGEEEFEPGLLARSGADLVTVDSIEELTREYLEELDEKYHPDRVIFECNGMVPVSKMEALDTPEEWGLLQKLVTVDASTFDLYMQNMKSLFVEMVRGADLVVFNRCKPEMPLASYRRSVKVVNQGADIIFESADGGEIENIFSEQMPYDLNAPVVKIEDMDYGIWYVDMLDHPEKYKGKTVEIQGRARKVKGFPKQELVIGRNAMTCCADDIQFLGFICKYKDAESLGADTWVRARGTVSFAFKKAYRGKGPVITLESVEKIPALQDELVYFN